MIIAIDDRMKDASGIGTYYTNVESRLPRAIERKYYSNYRPYVRHYNPLEQIQLTLFETQVEYDLFWTPNFNVPWVKPKKQVVTIHDCAHFTNYVELNNVSKRYAQLLYLIAVINSDKIITDTFFSADQIMKYLAVPSRKIEVISLGVDPYWFDQTDVKSPYQFPYYYFLGNLKPNKNLKFLLQVFKKVMKKIPEKLVIIGQKDGFRSSNFSVDEIEREFEGNVIFTGKISNDQLKCIAQHSKGLIFPSLYEGFGLPVVEAMALGKPVICNDIKVLRENFSDMALFYSTELDLIKILQSGGPFCKKEDRLVLDVKKKFSWDKTAREHSQLFLSL